MNSSLPISILSLLAALSFAINKSMISYIRYSMSLVLVYFAIIYFAIWALPESTTNNSLLVRIGLIVLLSNITFTNIAWFIFLRGKSAMYGRRKDDYKFPGDRL